METVFTATFFILNTFEKYSNKERFQYTKGPFIVADMKD